MKEAIISQLMDVASGQHKRIASLNTTLLDTVLWDPDTCPSPSYSTPRLQVTHKSQRNLKSGSTNAPSLSLKNRYSVLTMDSPAPVAPAQALPSSEPSTAPLSSSDSNKSQKSAVQLTKSSARRKILEEAVLRRSSGPRASATALQQSPPLHISSSPPPPAEPRPLAATQPEDQRLSPSLHASSSSSPPVVRHSPRKRGLRCCNGHNKPRHSRSSRGHRRSHGLKRPRLRQCLRARLRLRSWDPPLTGQHSDQRASPGPSSPSANLPPPPRTDSHPRTPRLSLFSLQRQS